MKKNKKTVGISTNYMGEYDNYVEVLKRNSKIEANKQNKMMYVN